MNLLEFAKNELKILEDNCKEDKEALQLQQLITKDVLDIIEVFSNQKHSGSSAPYIISLLKRLLSYKPVTPLTGEDDEWIDVSEYFENKKVWQNKRYLSVFKDENNNATCQDAIYFSNDEGHTFYTCRESTIPITFPYTVPDANEIVILDNKEKREDVKKSIYERLDTLFDYKLPEYINFNTETILSDYIKEDDLDIFCNAIKNIHNIDKFTCKIDSDIPLWELITIIIDSENNK